MVIIGVVRFMSGGTVETNVVAGGAMRRMASGGRVTKLVLFARISGMGSFCNNVTSSIMDLTGGSIVDTVSLKLPAAELDVLHLVIRAIGGLKVSSLSKISFAVILCVDVELKNNVPVRKINDGCSTVFTVALHPLRSLVSSTFCLDIDRDTRRP